MTYHDCEECGNANDCEACRKVVVACPKAIVDEARLAAKWYLCELYCPNRTDFYTGFGFLPKMIKGLVP